MKAIRTPWPCSGEERSKDGTETGEQVRAWGLVHSVPHFLSLMLSPYQIQPRYLPLWPQISQLCLERLSLDVGGHVWPFEPR